MNWQRRRWQELDNERERRENPQKESWRDFRKRVIENVAEASGEPKDMIEFEIEEQEMDEGLKLAHSEGFTVHQTADIVLASRERYEQD